MKTKYKILVLIFLVQTALLSQVEIISTKNTQTGECKGGVNLGFVASELPGASGQGNTDPRSEFKNHAIVKYNDKYYDPSYGSAIASDANNWETSALDGFGSMIRYARLNNNIVEIIRINWLSSLNDTSPQANIKP